MKPTYVNPSCIDVTTSIISETTCSLTLASRTIFSSRWRSTSLFRMSMACSRDYKTNTVGWQISENVPDFKCVKILERFYFQIALKLKQLVYGFPKLLQSSTLKSTTNLKTKQVIKITHFFLTKNVLKI